MNTVCVLCGRPIEKGKECKVRPPKDHAARGWSSFITVCPECAHRVAPHKFVKSMNRTEQVVDRMLEQEEERPGFDEIDWGEGPELKPEPVAGAVPEGWHRHPNGGGLVQDTAYVADTAYVGRNAQVYGNAKVLSYALVTNNAIVSGNAKVFGSAKVSGNALVSGHAKVSGNAFVSGDEVIDSGERS